MARDYAHRSSSSSGRRQTRNSNRNGSSNGGVPGWVWLIAGLSFGLAVAAFVYIKRPASAPLPGAADGALEHPADTNKTDTRKSGRLPALPLPPKEKERFTFYEILRNQEVVLPKEVAKAVQPPAQTAATPAGSGSYIIQVASYRSRDEADKQRASLALLGIESRIESVTIDGKDTFYRVRIGPDNNWAHVQTTMARLESNGIQALLVKLN